MEVMIYDEFDLFAERIKELIIEYAQTHPNSALTQADIKILTSSDEILKIAVTDIPRLCIFDVSPTGFDSIAIASTITNQFPSTTFIIFSTIYKNYIYKAVEMGTRPIGFVIKTLDYKQQLTNAFKVFDKTYKPVIKIKIGSGLYSLDDLIYIEPEKGKNYINIVSISGTYRERCTLSEAEAVSSFLFKLHKSMVINLKMTDVVGNHIVLRKIGKIECRQKAISRLLKAIEAINL